MPLIDVLDRTYGIGPDIEALALDPKGFGVREAQPEEAGALVRRLEELGFKAISSNEVHQVYVIEDGFRRYLQINGRPVRVFAAGNPVPEPSEPPPAPQEPPTNTGFPAQG